MAQHFEEVTRLDDLFAGGYARGDGIALQRVTDDAGFVRLDVEITEDEYEVTACLTAENARKLAQAILASIPSDAITLTAREREFLRRTLDDVATFMGALGNHPSVDYLALRGKLA